jgi:hypothetical protein
MDRKEWIKPYRDVVEQQFRLDDAARKDVDDFFARLEQMAAGQRDQAAFATAFMQSPLYQEYTGLFTKYQQMVVTQSGETVKEAAATMKKDSAKGLPGEYAKGSKNPVHPRRVKSHPAFAPPGRKTCGYRKA